MIRNQRSKLLVYSTVAIFSGFGIALSSLGMFMTAQTALKTHTDRVNPDVLGINNLVPFSTDSNTNLTYIDDVTGSKTCQIKQFLTQRNITSIDELQILDFPFRALLSNQNKESAYSDTIQTQLPTGKYMVIIQTHNPHSTKNKTQPNEKIMINFNSADNSVLTTSSATVDLPNDKNGLIQIVDNALEIPNSVSSLQAIHGVYPDTSSPNSIYPLCVGLIPVNTDADPTQLLTQPLGENTLKTTKNTPIEIPILGNDSDSDGKISQVAVSITDTPKQGTVQIVNDRINYTPRTNYIGGDKFEYKACDKDGFCDTAVVAITITDPNIVTPTQSKPTPIVQDDEAKVDAIDDNSYTDSNQPVTIDIISNDEVNNVGAIAIINNPNNATLYISPDNKVVYKPSPRYVGDDEFEYKICDTNNTCDTAKVKISVKPTGVVLGDADLVRSGGWSISGLIVFLAAGILSTKMIIKTQRHKLRVTHTPYNF